MLLQLLLRRRTPIAIILCVVALGWAFYTIVWSYATIYDLNPSERINVLLIGYHRSGSSLLGELLTSIENSSYFYEPLFYPHVEERIRVDDSVFIEKLYSCDEKLLSELISKSSVTIVRVINTVNDAETLKKLGSETLSNLCGRDNIHVSKTTRLRVHQALKLVERRNVPNLKIVHLMRDPRACYNSLQKVDGEWSEKFKSVDRLCEEMENDLAMSKHLPKRMYTRVRYEDLVEDPIDLTNQLFNALYHQDMGQLAKDYINTHMRVKNNTEMITNATAEYYNTYRQEGVEIDKWKVELSVSDIVKIEAKCRNVMTEMNYKFF